MSEIERDLATAFRILNPCVGMMNSILCQYDPRSDPEALNAMRRDVHDAEAMFTKYPHLLPKE